MILLGTGELAVSRTPGVTIKTFGLGSCVAAAIFHPASGAVGMVHVALWHSRTNLDKARDMPGYFADTGIKALFTAMAELTGEADGGAYHLKLAGGGDVADLTDTFMIGYRNIAAVKEAASGLGLAVAAAEVGGTVSRMASVTVGRPELIVSSPGMEDRSL